MKRALRETLIFGSIASGLGMLCFEIRNVMTAFYAESKSVTIYINRSGEQYFDILALIVFGGILVSGTILYLQDIRRKK